MSANETIFKSILLIEDDRSHAVIIRRALTGVCDAVTETNSLKEGLAALHAGKFELIVTDLNLPDAHQAQCVPALRAAGEGAPVIVLTSSTALSDAVDAMKAGAADFLVKNFDSTFKEILHLALQRTFAAQQLQLERSRLQREMEALRLAIDNSQDALAVGTPDCTVVYANSAWQALCKKFEGSPDRIDGIAGSAVSAGEKLAVALRGYCETLSPGAGWHTELRLGNDSSAAYELSLAALRQSEGGQQKELAVWVRDTTEQKRREKFQREILSTTTHDLKGPLGAISISADLLSTHFGIEGQAAEIVKRIASASMGALNLIEEFLSARRIQEGTFILKPGSTDVPALLREVVSNFEPMASVKKIALAVETPDTLIWKLDKLGAQRVVGNLLSNAIKFTKGGGQVTVKAVCGEGDLRISVADTGSGMAPAEVTKIFERFTRLEKHAGIPGSGLGLFVVKSIVEAHGGRVEVTSQVDRGTCFELVFPEVPPTNTRGELISLDFQ